MDLELRQKCVLAFYEIYPVTRKLVFDTFDKKEYNITRTQQAILLAMSISGRINMSTLAARVSTSNEQATRAVAQLVEKGYIIREHSPENRREVFIELTPSAEELLNKMKTEIMDDLIKKFASASDKEMEELYRSLLMVSDLLKKVIV